MARVTFQYDVIKDAGLRKQAETQAKEIKTLIRRSGEAVVQIGKRLASVRESMSPAMFRAWVEVEFCWNQSTASNYMQAAKVFGEADCLAEFQPSAIIALARRNVPQTVIDEAFRLARSGDVVTRTVVNGLFDRAGVKPAHASAGKHRKPETAAAALAVASTSLGSAEALRQTLDSFVLNLDQLAGALSPDDRNAIADRFLELAVQLRGMGGKTSSKPATKSPNRRKAALAAAS